MGDENMTMFCRKITSTITDIEKVCRLYMQEEGLCLNELEYEKYISSAQKVYIKMLENGSYTYGCFNENELLGVINVNKNWDYYPRYENNPYVHLETLIVSKKFQNNKIGTFLFENLMQLIKYEGVTYIIMQSDNEYVQKIAKKIGLNEHSYDMRIDYTI